MLPCEIWETLQNTFFTKHLRWLLLNKPRRSLWFVLWWSDTLVIYHKSILSNYALQGKISSLKWSFYCTPIDRALKMWFNEGSGRFLQPAILELWRYLYNQSCGFWDKRNTQLKERFEQFFVTKQRFLFSKKYIKKHFWVKWLYKIYLNKT